MKCRNVQNKDKKIISRVPRDNKERRRVNACNAFNETNNNGMKLFTYYSPNTNFFNSVRFRNDN